MYRDEASLHDAYRAGKNALNYAKDLTKLELQTDQIRVSAIAWQVIVIGEATKRLSLELRKSHPEVPWEKMVGMYDTLADPCEQINFETLWNIVCVSIPDVMAKIEPLLSAAVMPKAQ